MVDNEIIPDRAVLAEENLSNKISMASTANSSIFERTEVLTGNTPPCPDRSLIVSVRMASLGSRGARCVTSVTTCRRVTSAF